MPKSEFSGTRGKGGPAPQGRALEGHRRAEPLAGIQPGCEEQVRQPLGKLAITIRCSSQVATYLAVIEDHGQHVGQQADHGEHDEGLLAVLVHGGFF